MRLSPPSSSAGVVGGGGFVRGRKSLEHALAFGQFRKRRFEPLDIPRGQDWPDPIIPLAGSLAGGRCGAAKVAARHGRLFGTRLDALVLILIAGLIGAGLRARGGALIAAP